MLLAPWRLATSSEPETSARGTYRLERCPACGTVAIAASDRAEEPAALYETGTYETTTGRLDVLIQWIGSAIDRDRLRLLPRRPGARLIEIGAGDGRFLALAANAGYVPVGIEPAAAQAARAQAQGVPVEVARLEDWDTDVPADVVAMWHVLEHLEDPEAAIRKARSWLRPGGELIVAVPVADSFQAAVGGDRWFHQDVPRHRTLFTQKGLKLLLERSGFRTLAVHHVLLEHNPLGMWQTLLNRLTAEPNAFFRFVKRQPYPGTRSERARDIAVVALLGPLLAPVAVVLELTMGLLRRGGTVVVRAAAS